MKFLKGIFYTLAALVIALCAFILVCAVNPKLTEALAGTVQGAKIASVLDKLLGRGGDDGDLDISDDGQSVIINVPTNEVPAELANLTGYQPIESEEEKITDEVAESIKKSLSTGETGEDLTFDTLYYPYYGMLTADEQAVYRQIYANAEALNSSFAPVEAITADQLSKIFESVVNDHPELFFLNTSYSVKYTKSGSVVEIQLAYYTLANALDSAKENFESAANTVIAGAQGLESAYEKEKYVHDYLIDHVTYDSGAALGQSAYSALVNQRSVCAGYARANQYILQKLGIPCYYCTGYAGEDHAWNIVGLSDGFYNEDVTWDDTNPSTYDYFNKNDSDFSTTHTRTGLSVNLPPCNGSLYRGLEKGSTAEVEAGDPNSVSSDDTMDPLKFDELYPEKQETNTSTNTEEQTPEEAQDALVQALLNLGYKESDAVWTMEEYYEDCKAKLIAAGSGDRHFTSIVPAALFTQIEKEYGTGAYKKGYVEEALKELGMNRFSIQIQAERMGGGFYKLYHNVVSWKDETEDTADKDKEDNKNDNTNTNNGSNTNNNSNNNTNNNTNNNSNNNSSNNSNNSGNSTKPGEKEEEALEKAKAYLKEGVYSADALKKKLMESDSYSNSVAEYAIKNCGADWNDQAIKRAKEYVAEKAYSASALKKLLADTDLFTTEQAENAVNNAGIDYNQQAVKKAQEYLAGKDVYSAAGMKKVLKETDGFTDAEVAFAIENCGADWKAQAVKKAKEYKGESESITHDELVKKLTDDGFTAEEADYGAKQNGV